MTKKVNSSVFRLGYNLFWLYKKSNSFFYYNFKTLLNMLQKELNLFCFWCLGIKILYNCLFLDIYSYTVSKTQVFKLDYCKYFIDIKLYNLNYRVYTKIFLKQLNNFKFLSLSYNRRYYFFKFCSYFFYLEKLLFLKLLLSFFYWLNNLNLLHFLNVLKYLFLQDSRFFNLNLYSPKNFFFFKDYKLVRIKILEISLEYLVYKYYNYKFTIYLNNFMQVLNLDFFTHRLVSSKSVNFKKEKKSKFLICLFINFRKVELLCRYMGSRLYNKKRHYKEIFWFTKLISLFYRSNQVHFKGFKFYISGKLNGNMKRKKYSYKLGKIRLNSLNTLVDYFYLPLYTKFGVISLKMWLSY